MNEYLEDLLRRASDAFPDGNIEPGLNRYRAIVGPTPAEGTDAGRALKLLRDGHVPTPVQLIALEKLIRMMRPVLFVREGVVEALHADVKPSFPEWALFTDGLKALAYSFGAIFFDGSSVNPYATGFLVGPRLLMTNRHVAIGLTHGSGVLDPSAARVDFEQEYRVNPSRQPIAIDSVVAIHPDQDLALFRLASSVEDRPPLRFSDTDAKAGTHVGAVGYPMADTGRNPLFVNALFNGRFGVKRAAPGAIISSRGPSCFHDCTTLGGNSGSPLLSLETSEVIAVHCEGSFLVRNEAVQASVARAFLNQHAEAA